MRGSVAFIDWESELKKSPQFRKGLKKNAIVGITNELGEIQFINDNFCKISKYSREELLGKKHDLLKSGFHKEEFWKEFWKTISEEEIWKGKFRNKAKNGSIYWVETTVYPYRIASNEKFHYIAIATDITEKMERETRTQNLLKESENILNHIEIGVVSVDRDWRYTFLNDAAMANHWDKKENIIGRVFWDVHPEMRGTIFWAAYHEAMDTQKFVEIEEYYKPLDIWFRVKVYPTERGLSIFYSDISKNKKQDEQRDLLESIINSTQDAVVSMDLKGNITSWNKGAEHLYGYSAEEILGKDTRLLVPIHLRNEFEGLKDKMEQGKSLENYETIRITKSGSIVNVQISLSPITNAHGKIIGTSAIVRDITKMKCTQEALANSNRLYAFLSEINQSIVQIKSLDELAENACRIAQDVGGYKLAWIGLFNEEGKLHSDNYFGSKQVLEMVRLIPELDDTLRNKRITPTGTAIRTGEYAIIQDLLNDPNMDVFKERFRQNGLNSVIVYPLKKFGKVIGVFGLYSSEVNHFVEEEINLLTEASKDISFALELIDKDKHRHAIESEILKSESNLNHAQSMAHIGSFDINFRQKREFWSDEMYRILGYEPRSVEPSPVLFFSHVHPDDQARTRQNFQSSIQSLQETKDSFKIVTKDGKLKYVDTHTKFELDSDNHAIRMYGVTQDVSSQVEAEKQLEQTLLELEERVLHRTKELHDKNQSITDSINYAKRIQLALLTSPSVLKEVFEKSFMLSMPCNIVSGDFFWCHQQENWKFIVVADCTGHGVPGALMSIIGNNLLNQIIVDEGCEEPSNILYQLDEKLAKALGGNVLKDVKDGMDIAICKVNAKDQVMQFAGAFRPVFLASNDGRIHEIIGNRNSIGGGMDLTQKLFETKTYTFQPGNRFYLCSDGYHSQFGGEKGKKFMKTRFKELLAHLKNVPIREQKYFFLEKFKEWKGDNDQVDDILLVGIEV